MEKPSLKWVKKDFINAINDHFAKGCSLEDLLDALLKSRKSRLSEKRSNEKADFNWENPHFYQH